MLLVAKENPVREGPRKATENDMALGTLRRARHPSGGVMGSGAIAAENFREDKLLVQSWRCEPPLNGSRYSNRLNSLNCYSY